MLLKNHPDILPDKCFVAVSNFTCIV